MAEVIIETVIYPYLFRHNLSFKKAIDENTIFHGYKTSTERPRLRVRDRLSSRSWESIDFV